jgi:hypothetical protein
MASAAPAAAVGGCPSNTLCLYGGNDFTDLKVTTASTNKCVDLRPWFQTYSTIRSYVNNLPTTAVIWNEEGLYVKARTLPAGGFSSAIGVSYLGANGAVCMGGHNPNNGVS